MNKSGLVDKAESLANKMNKITEKFSKNIDTAEELVITGDDVIEYIDEKTQDIKLYSDEIPATKIINLDNLVEDFKFVRETLKENTENGRRVLNAVTLDLLDSDDEKRAQLILSFAELNKAMVMNMDLYINSYKHISNTLLNLDKIKKAEKESPQIINNTLNVNSHEVISTVDLIKKLSK